MKNKNKSKQNGFTLIEVMTVVVIVGIMLAVAAPSFSRMLKKNQVESTKGLFLSSLKRARLEAMSRGENVAVCILNSSDRCAAGLWQWGNGWVIFVDKNRDSTIDSDDVVIAKYKPSQQSGIYSGGLASGAFPGYIRFAATGQAYSGLVTRASSARTICVVNGDFQSDNLEFKEFSREITIDSRGRVIDKEADLLRDAEPSQCINDDGDGICQASGSSGDGSICLSGFLS